MRCSANLTQRKLADIAGVGVSYLSRLENGRVTPSARTMAKLAKALGVGSVSLFNSEREMEPGDRCPVSVSGACVLEHPFVAHGRRPASGEWYSKDYLKTLRAVNYILQKGTHEERTALVHTVDAMLCLHHAARR
jgi:transcriptional regulator with XRE-family HTH domain